MFFCPNRESIKSAPINSTAASIKPLSISGYARFWSCRIQMQNCIFDKKRIWFDLVNRIQSQSAQIVLSGSPTKCEKSFAIIHFFFFKNKCWLVSFYWSFLFEWLIGNFYCFVFLNSAIPPIRRSITWNRFIAISSDCQLICSIHRKKNIYARVARVLLPIDVSRVWIAQPVLCIPYICLAFNAKGYQLGCVYDEPFRKISSTYWSCFCFCFCFCCCRSRCCCMLVRI